MKNLLDEMDDFIDGKIFGEAPSPTAQATPTPEVKPKEKKNARESQVGSTFITIGIPGATAKTKKGAPAGKQKQDDSDDSADSDDSDDSDE